MRVKENACIYCDRKGNYGLMICCERCDSWYHYKCVHKKWDLNLPRSQLHYLADYYCYPCRRANPSLKLKYYSSTNMNSSDYMKTTDSKVPSRKERAQIKTINTMATETIPSKPIEIPSTSSSSHADNSSASSSSTSTNTSPGSSSSSLSSSSSCSTKSSSSIDSPSRSSSPSSLSSKSDEAIENKKPTMTSSTTTPATTILPTTSNCTRSATNCAQSSSVNNRDFAEHIALIGLMNLNSTQTHLHQQENDKLEKLDRPTVGKIVPKKAFKNNTGGRSNLRSNLEKAMRRQRHSSSRNYNS